MGIRAAAGGFFIDRLVETKGLDAIDKYKAKKKGEYLAGVQETQPLIITLAEEHHEEHYKRHGRYD